MIPRSFSWMRAAARSCVLGTICMTGIPALADGITWGVRIESLYPRIEIGRTIVIRVAYTNLPARASVAFGFIPTRGRTGINIQIADTNGTVIGETGDSGPVPHGDEKSPAATNGIIEGDIELPAYMTPTNPGRYVVRGSYSRVEIYHQNYNYTVRSDETVFEVVPPGTPTPERPRPWKEYEDLTLYPELKGHLLAMPMHRFEQAGLSRQVWLEVFCDADFPKEKRLAKFEHLLWHQRPFNEKLLPLALDEKTDEDFRLRALMLLGNMENNEGAKKELVRRYWRKDDAGQKSALYRMAFLYGDDRGTRAIPYGTVDPSPLVRALALFPLAQSARAQEVLDVALSLTNCTVAFPSNLFPSGEWMTSYPNVAAAAADYAGSARRALDGKIERKPVPPPADAAAQAEVVRRLFH